MTVPIFSNDEEFRLRAVEKYRLLDTFPVDSCDNITSIITHITNTPIGLITLLDKNRAVIKSSKGLDFNEIPRDISFSNLTIHSEVTIIEDTRLDTRFTNHPFVKDKNVVFYAGVPLINPDGYKLGTLCVLDYEVRTLNEEQIKALKTMAEQAVIIFEKHWQNMELLELKEKLEKRNNDLKKFTDIVSHDLKSPLANIISLTDLLADENKEVLNDTSLVYIDYLKTSSNALKNYIDGLYTFYQNEELLKRKKETIRFKELMQDMKKISFSSKDVIKLKYTTESEVVTVNKSALLQIFVNLVTNAIKYNDKPEVYIDIACKNTDDYYEFIVKDNGNGIPKEYLPTIFDIFAVVGKKDRYGNMGSGIGLAAVHKLVNNQEGDISLESEVGVGTTFYFKISKN